MLDRVFVEVAHMEMLRTESERHTEDVKTLSGLCVVCNGALEEKKIFIDATRPLWFPTLAVMPEEPVIEVADGYFCTQCGLRYEFIPGSHRGSLHE